MVHILLNVFGFALDSQAPNDNNKRTGMKWLKHRPPGGGLTRGYLLAIVGCAICQLRFGK